MIIDRPLMLFCTSLPDSMSKAPDCEFIAAAWSVLNGSLTFIAVAVDFKKELSVDALLATGNSIQNMLIEHGLHCVFVCYLESGLRTIDFPKDQALNQN